MNIDRGKESFTEEEIDALRQSLAELKAERSLSWPDLARMIGDVGSSTLGLWTSGTYTGDNAGVAYKVNRFFLSEEARRQEAVEKVETPAFRFTKTAREMTAQLRWAHSGEMALIVGSAGLGKTATFKQYTASTPNAFLATMSRATRSVTPMLRQVAKACGATGKVGTPSALVDIIEARLSGLRACVVIDEAQHLADDSLDQLRAFHDSLGCGLVLAGNPTVMTRVAGGSGRSAEFAQMHSRVSWAQAYERPHPEDVEVLCDAWAVSGPRERAFLQKVAQLPGHLRTVTNLLKMATVLAQITDEPRTLSHLQDAWSHRAQLQKTAIREDNK
jgi:DNA transposition AAA+ family ATPase